MTFLFALHKTLFSASFRIFSVVSLEVLLTRGETGQASAVS